jgi:hypothetical protein
LAKNEPDSQSRASGLFAGIQLGLSQAEASETRGRPRDVGNSRSGELRLIEALGRELRSAEIDFPRLVRMWAAPQAAPEAWLSDETPRAIETLLTTGSPAADDSFGPGLGATLVTLPVALRTHRTPANLVSGTYHISRLLDPHALGNWAAVTVNVAVACFMAGRRDFVPDALEALRSNEAPDALIESVQRVPIWKRPVTEPAPGREGALLRDLETILWALHHESTSERVETHLSGGLVRSIGFALIGARDGEAAVLRLAPERPPSADLRQLAEQLGC